MTESPDDFDWPDRYCTTCMWLGKKVRATHVCEYEYPNGYTYGRPYVSSSFGCPACASKFVWGLARNEVEERDQASNYKMIIGDDPPTLAFDPGKGVRYIIPLEVWNESLAQYCELRRAFDEYVQASEAIKRLEGHEL